MSTPLLHVNAAILDPIIAQEPFSTAWLIMVLRTILLSSIKIEPTLLHWLSTAEPQVEAIREQ